ncbi:MAG: N-acetyl-gamma-glutamyl-phosphate reductase [Kiritimatiellae bacterium]|nr:N-acetyl-gamma-glutamyl-phosphate reductase [Kiritimatiellia bacterium]MBP5225764.1 N-acetyl-gamma-glutamyl-phosphate reductase [Kiritimatiellia bacterium]
MIRVKVVGATGYGGIGIIELLLRHPEAKLVTLIAREDVGKTIAQVYPHLEGFCDLPILAADDPAADAPVDVVFFSTPDRVGMFDARAELEKGRKVIDYSGDFRFTTAEAYADYATRIGKDPVHASPDLLGSNAYGMVELHRDAIRQARVVGNPGCFACSCILGLAPAAKNRLVNPRSVICDCKSGISGAGKKLNAAHHYPQRYEQMNAYKLAGHQHVCEVERELSLQGGEPFTVTFTAQVVPVCRGIMSCLYGDLRRPMTEDEVVALYRDFYRDSPFVRVYGSTAAVGTMHVRGTNFCNLVVSVDQRTDRLRVVSYIDNLVKGQAGSALQVMNVMFGLPETTGLDHPGMYP